MSVLLYADDVLLIAPSVSSVNKLLHICEQELNLLDMAINAKKKSACVRTGARFRHHCSTVSTLDGRELRWEESIRYLDVHITSAKAFACLLANAKKSFYRAFNAVFGKVAGVASEEVSVELLKVKCLPVLLYGLEACPISNKQFNSLDFVLKGC